MAKFTNPISKIFTLIIKAYQYAISPLLGNCCRFYPTCSTYSIESLQTFGLFKGLFLSVKRILQCHPWHAGGFDPVPEKKSYANKQT